MCGGNMASDLDVTTATWGTQDLLPATGDKGEAVDYAQQVSKNTGYNFYRPFMVASQDSPITGASALLHKAYMNAGTYQAYCAAHMDLDAAGDSGTVALDGTNIVVSDGDPVVDGWVNNNAEVIVASDGYVDVGYTTVEATSASIDRSMMWVRQKS